MGERAYDDVVAHENDCGCIDCLLDRGRAALWWSHSVAELIREAEGVTRSPEGDA